MQDIAEVYARALFEAATEGDVLERVHDELGEFVDELERNRELRMFFFSPYFSSEEKSGAVGKVVRGADERFVRFLEMLAERHRMPILPRIRRSFDALWAEAQRLLPVNVISAVELDEQLVDGIGRRIQEQTGRRVQLSSKVDPYVVGGLVVRVGNMVLDASVRNRLEEFRKQIARGT